MSIIALNKPYQMICQFSPHPTRLSLANLISIPNVYPIGRLDADSEGLLLLTDEAALVAQISSPRSKMIKRYWVQVEGLPNSLAMQQLQGRLDLGDFVTQPCYANILDTAVVDATLWPRNPPIRYRAHLVTSWLEIHLTEGKNRQIRRMTAKIGHPTLRLVRIQIGNLNLFQLALLPGESKNISYQQLLTAKK